MKTLNETIKATPNYSKRTFTIRSYVNGKFNAKYRTFEMSEEEFESKLYNTEGDWENFFRTDNYYEVR